MLQDKKYKGAGLKYSTHGDIYQLKLLMLALIKGSTEKITFQLSTEDVN